MDIDKLSREIAQELINEAKTINEIPKAKVQQVDKFADKQLNPIDVDLTGKHFFDRLQDPRNRKEITQAELIGFFKRLKKSKKEFINFLNKYQQIVVTDDRTKLNIPFMKKANKAIAKTIMRKNNFRTSNAKLTVSHKENKDYDRVAFYEGFISNVVSEDFDVYRKGDKIIVELDRPKTIKE